MGNHLNIGGCGYFNTHAFNNPEGTPYKKSSSEQEVLNGTFSLDEHFLKNSVLQKQMVPGRTQKEPFWTYFSECG